MTDYTKCKLTKKSITFNAARVYESYNGAKCDQPVYMRAVWKTLSPKYEGKISGEVIDSLKSDCEDILAGKEPYADALKEAQEAEWDEKMKYSVGWGLDDDVQALISAGASPNYIFEALARRSSCNEKNLMEVLVSNGADVNAKDKDGNTPLHWAVYRCKYSAATVLLKGGADINAKDFQGRTPIEIAKQMRDGHMEGIISKFMTAE